MGPSGEGLAIGGSETSAVLVMVDPTGTSATSVVSTASFDTSVAFFRFLELGHGSFVREEVLHDPELVHVAIRR